MTSVGMYKELTLRGVGGKNELMTGLHSCFLFVWAKYLLILDRVVCRWNWRES
jgi:hypothetical protein